MKTIYSLNTHFIGSPLPARRHVGLASESGSSSSRAHSLLPAARGSGGETDLNKHTHLMANVDKCHREKHRAVEEEWGWELDPSLDYGVEEGFSELALGKNK